MKLLVILMLYFGLTAKAQEFRGAAESSIFTRYIFSGTFEPPGYTTIVGKDTTKAFPPYSAVTILTLLQAYSHYKAECWADSSLISYNYSPGKLDNGGNISYMVRGSANYIHGHGVSFRDFMDWLEKQRQR